MEINKKLSDGAVVLEAEGEITASEEGIFASAVNEAMAQTSKIVFDFEKVPYISSAGLRVLVNAKKQLDLSGGTMSVINASKEVREVFEITGFSDIFGLQ
jgi:anti-sigma B factor antagonist